MTSHRKRKKQARDLGLTDRELQLAEMLDEMLDAMRWLMVLGYSNQFLLKTKLSISPEERDSVLEAATRAVEKDARLHEWRARLAQVKGEMLGAQREVARARKEIRREAKRGARGETAAEHTAGDGGSAADAEADGATS